ncbi:MAG: NAD(P)/FAD-dependent oxidoreductase [Limnochordales bacterium]|nr:NAD(P)/FAD-dependent oxidoreductase [Limnochordales bacterium]
MKIRVLGAGYAGVRAALDLNRRLGRRPARISLINRDKHHELITELHRPAAGTTDRRTVAIPLEDIFSGTGVEVIYGTVTDIQVAARQVVLDRRRVLQYDRLVVALGSEPEFFSIPGLKEHSLTLSSLNSAEVIRQHIDAMFAHAATLTDPDQRRPYLTVVVAGGGFTGVEFAGQLADRVPALARRHGVPREEVRLITVEAAPDLLPGFDEPLIDAAVDVLVRKGVRLMLGVPIVAVEPGAVALEDGTRIAARTIVWSGGVRANRLVERCFTTRSRGRAVVNEYLQSVDDPRVYIIGDAALALDPKSGQPVPPTAQHAVQQGRLAARNLWAEVTGRPLKPYTPATAGVVATVGHGVGLARIGPFKLAGRFPAVIKDVNTWRYLYSLGGPGLLLKVWWRQLPLRPARA